MKQMLRGCCLALAINLTTHTSHNHQEEIKEAREVKEISKLYEQWQPPYEYNQEITGEVIEEESSDEETTRLTKTWQHLAQNPESTKHLPIGNQRLQKISYTDQQGNEVQTMIFINPQTINISEMKIMQKK